ncbi:MAG: T9SS type A sorting domain-containing protein [Ginsengibacter sp.]
MQPHLLILVNRDANVPNYNATGYGQADLTGTNNSKTYAIPQFYVPSGLPTYLVIWATGGIPSQTIDAFSISKIVITKTAPAPSFDITPPSVPFTCGTTSPVTFTVNNPGGITGITNYTWNLGATPNGWKLPDGSAAPATYSTGTVNTLTLTPVCGSVQKNISATVTASGNSYNTNTSSVSITPPSLSINGNSSFCTGSSNYFIDNLPCNASVEWSISPTTGIANLSCFSCTTTSLSQTGYGTVTLTAVVSNLCGGSNITLNKNIQIGNAPLTGTYSTASNTYSLQTVNFVPAGNIFAQYQWPGVSNISANLTSGSPSGTGFYSYPGGVNFTISSGQQVSVYIAGNSVCGSINATRTFIQSSYYYLVVSPNPASNNINVGITEVVDTTGKMANTQKQLSATTSGITKLYLYDFNTGALIKEWNFNEMKSSNYKLNIAGVKTGVYLLKMERNNKTTSQKIIIE